MNSMTGFGRGENQTEIGKVTVDIKSVNGKFLDINIKQSKIFAPIEDFTKNCVSKRLFRGSVDLYINFTPNSETQMIDVDLCLAEKYNDISKEVAKLLNKNSDVGVSKILNFPDVLSITTADVTNDQLKELIEPALTTALDSMCEMRACEGENMKKDLIQSIYEIELNLKDVTGRVPRMLSENKAKLEKRIKEILGEVEVDQSKLANEIAFYVDKVDINEEIKRLMSHIEQFRQICTKNVVGKQLEFLSQEITREINTMGSKSNDIEITKRVLAMKNSNEKFKEQIRNIE